MSKFRIRERKVEKLALGSLFLLNEYLATIVRIFGVEVVDFGKEKTFVKVLNFNKGL